MTPLASFAKAVATCKPDLVIPCDDLSTMHLHELYSHTQPGRKNGDDLRALIERSLGAPAHFSVLYDRTATIEIARAEGLRVPPTEIVGNWKELQTWITRWGLPA